MINAGKQGVFSWKGRVAEDRGEKNGELKEIVKILVSILILSTVVFAVNDGKLID